MSTKHLISKEIKFLLVFYFLLIGYHSTAQTPEQIKQITSSYDLVKLSEIQNEFENEFIKDQKRINELAESLKLPLIIKDEEGYAELQRIMPDGTPIYNTTDNADAAHSTRTDFLNQGGGLGLDLMGENMTAYVWDEALARVDHQEYKDSFGVTRYSEGNSGIGLSSHAAHVTGTIIGKGVEADAKGMAPKANAVGYDWNADKFEAGLAAANGMLVSNHSYGWRADQFNNPSQAYYFGSYHQEARDWDIIMYYAPYYLMVNSAGNNGSSHYNHSPLDGVLGYDKLTGKSLSKNSLIVANANDAAIDANGELIYVSINGGSSQGPSDDYRIKPDITGNGTEVYSSTELSNSSYNYKTGTSMSSPNVTGTLLLLQEHYNNLNSVFMRAATLKGLVLHTADDAGPVGPDADWGWGLLNAKKAAETISSNGSSSIIQELDLSNGNSYQITVYSDGINDLKASISWTDPPGDATITPNSNTPVLKNDLDLRVTKGGETFYPWKLTGVKSNDKGDNITDPFERIDIEGAKGEYTIQVSHKGNLVDGHQNYSLTVTGISDTPVLCTSEIPTNLTVEDISLSDAFLTWNIIPASNYEIRYRPVGVAEWYSVYSNTNSVTIADLFKNIYYEAQVKSICSIEDGSGFSDPVIFKTLDTDENCEVDYSIIANDGWGPLSDLALASDFAITQGADFKIETLKLYLFSQASSIEIGFYKDEGALPGETVVPRKTYTVFTQTLVPPYSTIFEIEIDLSAENIILKGDDSNNLYWISVKTVPVNISEKNYWAKSTQINNNTVFAVTEDYVTWGGIRSDYDGGFVLQGTCDGSSNCIKPGNTDGQDVVFSYMGITTNDLSIEDSDWPNNIPGGHLVLDSKDKGLVITHLNNSQRDQLTPVEGMIIYNTDEECVQIYRGNSPLFDPSDNGWKCIEFGCE